MQKIILEKDVALTMLEAAVGMSLLNDTKDFYTDKEIVLGILIEKVSRNEDFNDINERIKKYLPTSNFIKLDLKYLESILEKIKQNENIPKINNNQTLIIERILDSEIVLQIETETDEEDLLG